MSVKFVYNYRDSYLLVLIDWGGNLVYVDDVGFFDVKIVYCF